MVKKRWTCFKKLLFYFIIILVVGCLACTLGHIPRLKNYFVFRLYRNLYDFKYIIIYTIQICLCNNLEIKILIVTRPLGICSSASKKLSIPPGGIFVINTKFVIGSYDEANWLTCKWNHSYDNHITPHYLASKLSPSPKMKINKFQNLIINEIYERNILFFFVPIEK